jgi:predicted glycogen debranching enzyme
MKPIFPTEPLIRNVSLDVTHLDPQIRSRRGLYTEWIVTNALGGYASGTVGGINTRRFHGWLIAALPAPHGRMMMVNSLRERFYIGDKQFILNSDDVVGDRQYLPDPDRPSLIALASDPISPNLDSFRLEDGLPVWTYHMDDTVLEKRICLVHTQNTSCISYTLLQGKGRLEVQPALHIRSHDDTLEGPPHEHYRFTSVEHGFELYVDEVPPLKFLWQGNDNSFRMEDTQITNLRYWIEQSRGYDWQGNLWSPGFFSADLTSAPASLILSTEEWDQALALTPAEAFAAEIERRRRLLRCAPELSREGFSAELIFAADQFLITPVGRTADQVRTHAIGDQLRSVIAGYHWFTDWGRDTMISLDGLTLATGRHREAESILRSFSTYIRRGLIPNMFPEGEASGLYHTADATLWFFHAIDRYITETGDLETLKYLLPKLVDIVDWHLRGTDFGIGVDPSDDLLRQGATGYQLTWMDAKVGDWVVTPRRGKAVEINALWYNALCLTCDWIALLELTDEPFNGASALERYRGHAARTRDGFQKRFWNVATNCLFDVVDSPRERNGELVDFADDPSIRPNQVIAISLKHSVLDHDKWKPVLENVKTHLLTPVGLRSLSPIDKNYKAKYDGDIFARDAAYHQGTVWAWLIGPFIDAWHRTYPDDLESIRSFLRGFDHHLYEDGVGTISEIFDAEPPFTPRGCMAQAWSVAEVLRCQLLLYQQSMPDLSHQAIIRAS